MKKIILLMVCAIVGLSAIAKGENDSIVAFTISPAMHCINCENKIKGNLRFEKGVKEIKAEAPGSIVTVTFDKRKTDVENIVKGFSKLGYTALPATTSTKECCKDNQKCCKDNQKCCKKSEGCCKETEDCSHKPEGCCGK